MLPYPGEDVQGLHSEESVSLGGQVEEKADLSRVRLYVPHKDEPLWTSSTHCASKEHHKHHTGEKMCFHFDAIWIKHPWTNPSPDAALYTERINSSLGFKTTGCSAVRNIYDDLRNERQHRTWCVVDKLSLICNCRTTRLETVKPFICSPNWCDVICLHKTLTNITPRHSFSTGGKYFHTPQNSSLSCQAARWPASPLCLYLSSYWPFRKNYTMAKTSPPFPGSLATALRSSKSFLFISVTILTGCRCWEAKMSTSVPAAAAAGAAH